MLTVKALSVQLDSFALHDISIDVPKGAYYVLLGASGVGKTVLLETIAGLTTPSSGEILLDGRIVTHAPIQSRSVGLVYQDQALFPHLSVGQNIAYGPKARGLRRNEVREIVAEAAQLSGVGDLLERRPAGLSGGEAQRVALARTLATKPRCLLLDEPLSSLDRASRTELRALLRTIHRAGQTIVHVTHDYEEAVSLATHVAVMENGTIAQSGSPQTIFQHPKSEFIARFVGIRNFFKGILTYREGAEPQVGEFATSDLVLTITCDAKAGPGSLMLRSEDITVSANRPEGSARNTFAGTVTDLAPTHLGVEVMVDIGVEIAALLTKGAVKSLGIEPGKEVWVSFKATAGRFIEE